jgi:hypothetical protein
LATIRKTPGVKPDEIQWRGLDSLDPNQAVTREQFQDILAANKYEVKDVVKVGGGKQWTESEVWELEHQAQRSGTEQDWLLRDNAMAEYEAQQLGQPSGTPIDTKFAQSDWQSPGGENYREILLQGPDEVPGPNMPPYSQTNFTGGHFDEPNVLAHARVNDRMIGNRKTLFAEEIQSDWHQKGRKSGYKGDGSIDVEIHKNGDALTIDAGFTATPRTETAGGFTATLWDVRNPQGEVVETITNETAAREALQTRARGGGDLPDGLTSDLGRVPDAPFKKTWPDLTLKRLVKEAVDNDYDQIAWTTGATQAKRYPEALRQAIDNIHWRSDALGETKIVYARPKGSETPMRFEISNEGTITGGSNPEAVGKSLDDLIGQDMSKQIMDANTGDIDAKDFIMGAKGMEGFYDDILVKKARALGKKYGATVERKALDDGTEVWVMEIPDAMRGAARNDGVPLFSGAATAAALGGAAAATMAPDTAEAAEKPAKPLTLSDTIIQAAHAPTPEPDKRDELQAALEAQVANLTGHAARHSRRCGTGSRLPARPNAAG